MEPAPQDDQAAYPAAWEADVLLRNGRPVRLRPIVPQDAPALAAFHEELSDRTVYFRFFMPKPRLTEADLARFTRVDHRDRVALVALQAGTLVGVGRYDALGDGTAEVAFVIRDDVQGQGLGSILLEHLAAAARENGIRRFVAEVLPENARMLATFREAGFAVDQHREEDVLVLGFDISPTQTSRSVMASREHRFEAQSVRRLLHPRGVAVVGASRSGRGLGHAVLENIARAGYRGLLVAVHPEATDLLGVPCVPSLREARGVDLAVVVVPAESVAATVRDAAEAGVHGLVVVSGGFDDGELGGELQAELVDLVHRTGMRLVGPNALGLVNTDPEVRLNASLVRRMPEPGSVGLLCQSGALSTAILDRFLDRGLGVSTFLSAGNRADISGNDLLQYWEDDPRTGVVALYLESIGNARKFTRLVNRVASGKPVVMVRSGGAGRRHPLGHQVGTTELGQRAVDQVLADTGLVVVDDIEALVDVARVAAQQPLPAADGVAIVGNSDAVGVLAANALAGTGLRLVRPPVALARRESAEAYREALAEASADPRVGVVLAVHVPPVEHPSDAGIREVLRETRQDGTMLLAVLLGGDPRDTSVTAFEDVERAIRAADAVAGYARWRRESGPAMEQREDRAVDAPAGEVGGEAAVALLADLGIPLTLDVERADRARGARIQLAGDPLFGDVASLGVDDAVARLLDDVSYRLAPLDEARARGMLDALGARAALGLDESGRRGLAGLVARVSMLPTGVRAVELRGVVPGADGSVSVLGATVRVGEPGPVEAVRRL